VSVHPTLKKDGLRERKKTMKHAINDVRDRFRAAIEEEQYEGIQETLRQLNGCTDIMPSSLCDDLDLATGSTYQEGRIAFVDALNNTQTPI
jgi:hypothetical protein